MDKKILPHITTAQLILILVVLNTLLIGYIGSSINYNRQLSLANQDNIYQLLNGTATIVAQQGHISTFQRQSIINDFIKVAKHGGVATNDNVSQLTEQISNLTHTIDNLKLGRSQ